MYQLQDVTYCVSMWTTAGIGNVRYLVTAVLADGSSVERWLSRWRGGSATNRQMRASDTLHHLSSIRSRTMPRPPRSLALGGRMVGRDLTDGGLGTQPYPLLS